MFWDMWIHLESSAVKYLFGINFNELTLPLFFCLKMMETGRKKSLEGNGWSPQDSLWQEVPTEQHTVTGSEESFFPESSAAVWIEEATFLERPSLNYSDQQSPKFVLKIVRVFSDFRRNFDSSFLQGQPLLWVPPPEALWSLLSLIKPSPGTVPRHRVEELGNTK